MASTIAKIAHLQIPLEDVLKATNNFHNDNIIGRGGFGPIYKGQLQLSGELIMIAALRLDRKLGEGSVEFWTEISMLSDLKHTNIVSIVGFCEEKDEKIIITRYESKNGSLQEHLNNPNLTWTQRLKICVGVAHALSYLHNDDEHALRFHHNDQGRGYSIIHLNVNSSTILLDENWEAKLSGFKASIKQPLNRMDRVFLSDPIGTMGYLDPEIVKNKGVTYKSDIYAFGVVLFEILCGRRAYIKNDANSFLDRLAKDHYKSETLHDIIHPDLRNQMSPNQISVVSFRKCSKLAYSCLMEDRAYRPDMVNIVEELEKALKLALNFQPRQNFGKNLEHLKIPLDKIKLATNNFSDRYKFTKSSLYTWYAADLGHFDKGNFSCATHNFSDTYKVNFSRRYTWYAADDVIHFDKGNSSSVEKKSTNELSKIYNSVTIKRFFPNKDNHEEDFFFAELELLTSIKHHNIVKLIGFCVEGFEMILVMEKFSNRYLSDYLGNVNGMRILTWEKRLKICIDVAQALVYLHSKTKDKKGIVHNYISSTSIALDENWGAKIEDFELAVFLPPNIKYEQALCEITGFELSFHVDPEYKKSGKPKTESDVYSFGVVLLEILCGKHAHEKISSKEEEHGLVLVARRNFRNGTTEDMIDPTLKEENDQRSYIPNSGANKDSLHIFIKIANKCVEETQNQRPTMKVVLKELERALFIQEGGRSQDEGSSDLSELWWQRLVAKQQRWFGRWRNMFRFGDKEEERVQQPDRDNGLEIATPQVPEEEGVQRQITKGKFMFELIKATLVVTFKHLTTPLSQIKSVTDNFSETYLIKVHFDGHSFYRADIEYYDEESRSSKRHNNVTIKRYPYEDNLNKEIKFFKELTILGAVKHPNIVTLLGFCLEDSEMILVLDNFSNGFLGDYLVGLKSKHVLTWEKRLKICIDVAHALRYMHFEMEHRRTVLSDMWSYNIGLDENFRAKIVHVGSTEFLPDNQEEEAQFDNWVDAHPDNWVSTARKAYTDPEYERTHKIRRESDVYSFGIVLCEILGGRLFPHDPFLRQFFLTTRLEDLIDPIIKEETDENNFVLNKGPNKDSLHIFIGIAHKCIAETQDERPTMKVVVEELEKALFFQKNNKDNPKMLLEDIKRVTQNFNNKNCIGGGGFGRVYKGNLQDGDGFKTIVAKRLDTRFGQGEQQFLSELQILLDYKHENVVDLVGYCDENDEKVIVYEYASRGSLDRYLNDTSLTWVKRLNICIDVARALDFLHGGVGKQAKVIHRDIKTENILLNDDWKAKLADFGLSLISPLSQEMDYVIDHACGTIGYLDPLYRKSGFLTIESDIYSFGVVLFEILCGRSTFAIKKHEGHYLPEFIKNIFEAGKHNEVVFEKIREQIMPKSLTIFQKIAYKCLHDEREKRPTSEEILRELKKALEFQVHSTERDEKGCSGPDYDTLTETVGDKHQLSNKYSKAGKQVQDPELCKHTEQDPAVSSTDSKATIMSPENKQRVLEHLRQKVIDGNHQLRMLNEVIHGEHQVSVLKEEVENVEMSNKSLMALIQSLEEEDADQV